MPTVNRVTVCGPIILLGAAVAARAGEAPRCAEIADAAARLACYDAQAPKPADPAEPAAPAKVEEPADVVSVEAHVVGALKGWHKGTLFTLDNGQVWKVDDGSEQYYADLPDNPKVAIARGYLGGYWMTIENVDRKVKVRRVLELRKKK